MTEIYVSTDVETNSPAPGLYSMLSLGSAAFTAAGKRIATFSGNLKPLEGTGEHPATMAWWKTQPEAWAEATADAEAPESLMPRYSQWLTELPGKPVFVAYPAAFDFMFVYWYLIRFTGESPFGFSALDIKSYAMAMLKKGYKDSVKRNMPRKWFGEGKHSHKALDDAIEQGELFCNMLNANGG